MAQEEATPEVYNLEIETNVATVSFGIRNYPALPESVAPKKNEKIENQESKMDKEKKMDKQTNIDKEKSISPRTLHRINMLESSSDEESVDNEKKESDDEDGDFDEPPRKKRRIGKENQKSKRSNFKVTMFSSSDSDSESDPWSSESNCDNNNNKNNNNNKCKSASKARKRDSTAGRKALPRRSPRLASKYLKGKEMKLCSKDVSISNIGKSCKGATKKQKRTSKSSRNSQDYEKVIGQDYSVPVYEVGEDARCVFSSCKEPPKYFVPSLVSDDPNNGHWFCLQHWHSHAVPFYCQTK